MEEIHVMVAGLFLKNLEGYVSRLEKEDISKEDIRIFAISGELTAAELRASIEGEFLRLRKKYHILLRAENGHQ